jgi:hypothetical protein
MESIKHEISSKQDLAEFLHSQTCKEIEEFVSLLAQKIKGSGNSLQRKTSPVSLFVLGSYY